jgi:hypothetical protein
MLQEALPTRHHHSKRTPATIGHLGAAVVAAVVVARPPMLAQEQQLLVQAAPQLPLVPQ